MMNKSKINILTHKRPEPTSIVSTARLLIYNKLHPEKIHKTVKLQ